MGLHRFPKNVRLHCLHSCLSAAEKRISSRRQRKLQPRPLPPNICRQSFK